MGACARMTRLGSLMRRSCLRIRLLSVSLILVFWPTSVAKTVEHSEHTTDHKRRFESGGAHRHRESGA